MLDQIEYRTIKASLRPPRIAVAYQRPVDWIYSARQVIRSLSMIWGGSGAIMIPVYGDRIIAPELLPMFQIHDPDHILMHEEAITDLTVDDSGIDDRTMVNMSMRAGETRYRARQRLSKGLAEQADGWCSPFKAWPRDKRSFDQLGTLHRHNDRDFFLSQIVPTPGEVVYTLDLSGIDPMYALMIESRVGALAEEIQQGLSVIQLPVFDKDLPAVIGLAITGEVDGSWDLHNRHLAAIGAAATAEPPVALAGDAYLACTPFARAHRSLVKVSTLEVRPPIVCVVGDSAEDHALAMLCDRAFEHGVWAPLKLLREDSQVGRAARLAVRQLPWRARVYDGPILVVSVSETPDAVEELVAEIKASLTDEINAMPEYRNRRMPEYRDLQPAPLSRLAEQFGWSFLADGASFELRRAVPVRQADGELSLLTPISLPAPSAVQELGEDISWCIDVVVPDHLLPARTGISSAALVRDLAKSLPDTVVRVSRYGLSFFSRNVGKAPDGVPLESRLAQPLLRLPSAEGIFAELAAKHYSTVQRSAAGRRSALAVELWGSLDAITADLAGDLRRLLDAFILRSAAARTGDYGHGYAIRGDGYLTLRHAVQVLGVDEYHARDMLDRLLALKVLRRGLLLSCERCRAQAFYPIGTVSEDGFTCLVCGYSSRLLRGRWYKKDTEPAWSYALDQVVRDLLKQHGDIPLLAAARCSARAGQSFLWAPELLVEKAGRGIAELDLCLILDGEVVIGEAKSNGRLETTDKGTTEAARQLVQAAQLLSADKIVLATAKAGWAQGVVATVQQAIATEWTGGPRPKVIEMVGVGLTKGF